MFAYTFSSHSVATGWLRKIKGPGVATPGPVT